jgi:GT2 family glycosyltransferase
VEAIGGFDESLTEYGAEDIDLGYRLHASGLAVRSAPDAWTLHVGPDPQRSGDVIKAASAGRNAARLAIRQGSLAFPLGVAPWMLAIKRILWGGPWAALADPKVRAYELAYARGAREAWSSQDVRQSEPAHPPVREDPS